MGARTVTVTRSDLRGVLAAGLAASGFSLSLISAGFAFKVGADPATLVAFRGVVGLVIGIVMVRFLTTTCKLSADALVPLVLTTVGMMFINYGYMGAIRYIPISLATLVFYMFPMLVLCVSSIVERKLPSALSGTAFLMAFAGLALALGNSLGDLDWRGLMLALVATVGGVMLFFFGSRTAKRTSISLFTLYSQLIILLIGLPVMIVLGGPNLPSGTTGGFALLGICLGYLTGISMQFFAVRLISPSLAALIFNVEPVITISLSALLLGDVLSLGQYGGGALVIGSVILATRATSSD